MCASAKGKTCCYFLDLDSSAFKRGSIAWWLEEKCYRQEMDKIERTSAQGWKWMWYKKMIRERARELEE